MQATHPCVGDVVLIKRTLASVPLFEDWPPLAFAELCDGSKIIRYDLNETVIQQGVVLQACMQLRVAVSRYAPCMSKGSAMCGASPNWALSLGL